MVTHNVPVNRNILVWARREANLSTVRAVSKAGIKDLKARGRKEGLAATVRLQRWEEGIETPTLYELEKLAKAYRRPVLTFFLQEPPIKQTRLQDFRTIGNKALDSDAYSPEFSALLRRTEALQLTVRDLLLDMGSKPLPFVATAAEDNSPVQVARNIRRLLDFSFDDQRRIRDYDGVFYSIRTRAESLGVFTLLEGNLGSYHSNISAEVFRGLAISDDIAPFILINPNDAKPAKTFSLIHEICHILRGETGISNWNSIDISVRDIPHRNELFCDQVAAEFLVPTPQLLDDWGKQAVGYEPQDAIDRIAREYSVSRIAIARRLRDLDQITPEFYWEFFDACKQEWLQRGAVKAREEVKISLKIRTRSRLGNRLTDTIIRAAREGRISELDASRLLNVKINNFSRVV